MDTPQVHKLRAVPLRHAPSVPKLSESVSAPQRPLQRVPCHDAGAFGLDEPQQQQSHPRPRAATSGAPRQHTLESDVQRADHCVLARLRQVGISGALPEPAQGLLEPPLYITDASNDLADFVSCLPAVGPYKELRGQLEHHLAPLLSAAHRYGYASSGLADIMQFVNRLSWPELVSTTLYARTDSENCCKISLDKNDPHGAGSCITRLCFGFPTLGTVARSIWSGKEREALARAGNVRVMKPLTEASVSARSSALNALLEKLGVSQAVCLLHRLRERLLTISQLQLAECVAVALMIGVQVQAYFRFKQFAKGASSARGPLFQEWIHKVFLVRWGDGGIVCFGF